MLTAPGMAAATPNVPGPFSHQSVIGQPCVNCHGPASGSGKPADHIASSDSCQSCHMTLAWMPVRAVDHTQVRGACATCHNGKVAGGKPLMHIASSNACETCHTTNAWMPARFDHAAVAPHTCITCHNAVRAIGLPRNHIPTSQQCDTCHGTLAWLPAKLDHSGIHSGCQSCHNNTNAVGKPAAHMVMQRDCATCHTYPDWSLVAFRHVSAAYPGTHRAALSCVSCHTTNTDQIPYPYAASAGTCGGCHAKDFKPAAHPKTVKGVLYSASELSNCSGACHVYSDPTRASVTKSLPGPYHRVSDAAFKH
jgi:Cytochrome c7 and related cytochrome c